MPSRHSGTSVSQKRAAGTYDTCQHTVDDVYHFCLITFCASYVVSGFQHILLRVHLTFRLHCCCCFSCWVDCCRWRHTNTYTANCHIAVLTLLIICRIVGVVVVANSVSVRCCCCYFYYCRRQWQCHVNSVCCIAQLRNSTDFSALRLIIELCSFICTLVQLLCSWQ